MPPKPGQDVSFDSTNRYLDKLTKVTPVASKLKNLLNSSVVNKEAILDYWESVKKAIDPVVRGHILYLFIKPIQRAIGRLPGVVSAEEAAGRLAAITFVESIGTSKEPGVNSMRDSLPKGVNPKNFTLNSPQIRTALDKIINKLAALQQPLGMRPDYDSGQGTTGDMAERLGQIKKSLSENEATMIKQIPPMPEQLQSCSPESPAIEDYDEGPQPQAEGPKIIVIENYDDAPEVSCCPGCGQTMPEQMTREASTSLDHKFRAIRDAVRKGDLKESLLKTIYSNLDIIYEKYQALEKDVEKD